MPDVTVNRRPFLFDPLLNLAAGHRALFGISVQVSRLASAHAAIRLLQDFLPIGLIVRSGRVARDAGILLLWPTFGDR